MPLSLFLRQYSFVVQGAIFMRMQQHQKYIGVMAVHKHVSEWLVGG